VTTAPPAAAAAQSVAALPPIKAASPAAVQGPPGGITGTVSDATGTGISGATVQVTDSAGAAQSFTSDSQGLYAAKKLAPGIYNVQVSNNANKILDSNVVISPGQMLTLGVGLGPTPEPGKPLPPGADKGAIVGTITDPAGNGLGSAALQLNGAGGSQSFPADGQGQYAATDIAAGTYDLTITAKGTKIFAANIAMSPGEVLTLGVAGKLVAQKDSLPSVAVTAAPALAAVAGAGAATQGAPSQVESAPPATPEAAPTVAPATSEPAGGGQATASIGAGPGSISGLVTDQTGAVIVGAQVKLSTATGATHTAVSDAKGNYIFRSLPAGSYSIAVTAKGFKDFQADHIGLTEGGEIPLDASLEPAATGETINVEGSKVATVETENAEVSGTITQKEVSTLQLNGRNFTQLITLTPGVSNQTGQDEAKVGVQGSVKYSVNGGRVEYNSFEVDGSDVLNAGLSGAESTLVVYPSLDAIQEVKVLTSNYGAQYGRTASGTVQVTTKSGGAHWHGGGYEFFRNEFMNARNYFDQTTKAPLYRRNDFGYNLGGPLYIPGHYNVNKDKTFIFFSQEFRYEKSPSELQSNFNRAVPTLAERQGDFSDVCPSPSDPSDLKKLFQPATGVYEFPIASYPDCPYVPGTVVGGFGQMFGNVNPDGTYTYNNIATGVGVAGNSAIGLDHNALAILNQNLVPLPNSFTGCNSTLVGQVNHTTGAPIMPCYDAVISEPTHWREELFRIDHNFSSRYRGTFRYIHDSWDTVTPTPNWGTVINTFPTAQNRFVGPGTDMLVRLTQTLSPTLLNETLFSYTNSDITLTNVNGPGGANYLRPAGLGDPNQVGQCTTPATGPLECPMGYLFNNGFGNKVPGLIVAGNNGAYGGSGFAVDPSYTPWQHTNPTYNFRDDVSKAFGKHTLQLGVQYVLAQKNETNGALGAATGDLQGLLTVSNVNGGPLNTGNAFANFLYNAGPAFKGTTFTGGGNAIKSYLQDSAQLRYYNRYQIAEPFVQDDWKVNSRLTLNLGVRFSLFGNYHEKYLQAYNWDPKAFSQKLASEVKVDPYTGQLISIPGNKPIPLNLASLDPRITNGIVRCGQNGVPAGCVSSHIFNPAPRIGVAWDPTGSGKTSIRAGYGIFFEHGTGDEANTGSLEGSAPPVLSVTQPFPVGYACIGNYGSNCNASGGISSPGAFPLNVTSIPTNTKYSYSQQWSLSVQRELPSSFVATFAYVGSKGTRLTVERQLNQIAPVSPQFNPFALNEPIVTNSPTGNNDCNNVNQNIAKPAFVLQNGVVVSSQNPASVNLQIACQGESFNPGTFQPTIALANTFRTYPGIGEIYSLQNGADSSYHGFQTTVRRTKGPLTAGVAYSFSHSIDDSSDRTDPNFVNSLDLKSNRASSSFDQRHLLNISYVYTLPKLSHALQNWESSKPSEDQSDQTPSPGNPSRWQRLVGDGWQLSGIVTFQSGTPFSVINAGSPSGIGVSDNAGVANGVGAGSYPDIVKDPVRPAITSNASSFGPLLGNPNEFVAPRGLTFGDAGRNVLNNPSRLNFDMALLKHFAVTEGSQLEFRAEAFNIFNHTQFRIFDPNFGNTGTNTVSCYGGSNYSAGAYFPGGVDCLTGSSFLHPVDAHRPRTLQLALKYSF
jgi:hypothetical protein